MDELLLETHLGSVKRYYEKRIAQLEAQLAKAKSSNPGVPTVSDWNARQSSAHHHRQEELQESFFSAPTGRFFSNLMEECRGV
jgi:hypothetical protein